MGLEPVPEPPFCDSRALGTQLNRTDCLFYPLVLAKKSVDRSKRIITDRDMSVLKDFVQLIPKLIATHYDFDGNQNTPS